MVGPGASVGGKKQRVNENKQSSKPEKKAEDPDSKGREPDKDSSPKLPLTTEFMNRGNRNAGTEPSTKSKERFANEDGKSSQADDHQSKFFPELDSEDQKGKDTSIGEAKRNRKRRADEDVVGPEPKKAKAAEPTEDPGENYEGCTSGMGVLSTGQKPPAEKDEEPLKTKRLKTGDPNQGTDTDEDRASNVEIFNRGRKRAASESEALPEVKRLKTMEPLLRGHSSSAIYIKGGRGSQSTRQTAKDVDEGKKYLTSKGGQLTTPKKRGIARPVKRNRKSVYDEGAESSRNMDGVRKATSSENTLKDSSRKGSRDKQESSKLPSPEVKERNQLEQKHKTEKTKVVKESIEIRRPRLVYSDNYTSPEEKMALLPQYYFFKSRVAKGTTNGQKCKREEGESDKTHKKHRTVEDAKELEKPATEASPPAPNVPRNKISLSAYMARKVR